MIGARCTGTEKRLVYTSTNGTQIKKPRFVLRFKNPKSQSGRGKCDTYQYLGRAHGLHINDKGWTRNRTRNKRMVVIHIKHVKK